MEQSCACRAARRQGTGRSGGMAKKKKRGASSAGPGIATEQAPPEPVSQLELCALLDARCTKLSEAPTALSALATEAAGLDEQLETLAPIKGATIVVEVKELDQAPLTLKARPLKHIFFTVPLIAPFFRSQKLRFHK